MDPISEIQIYLSVVEHGSFTKAAKALDLSKSYVSKRVKALEDRLRARLLHRTTRAVQTTPAGQQFFEQARDAIQHLRDAEASVSAQTDTPSGRMRITVPQSFGTLHLTPVLLDFAAAYPEVEIEVHYTDRKVDLVEAGFDLGIRIGKLMDSSMVAQRLTPMTAHLVASPAYLASCGRLVQPEDLSDTAALIYTLAPAPNRWTLTHRTTGETRRIKVKGRLEFINMRHRPNPMRLNGEVTVDWDGTIYGGNGFLHETEHKDKFVMSHLDAYTNIDRYWMDATDNNFLLDWSYRRKVTENNIEVGKIMASFCTWMRKRGIEASGPT